MSRVGEKWIKTSGVEKTRYETNAHLASSRWLQHEIRDSYVYRAGNALDLKRRKTSTTQSSHMQDSKKKSRHVWCQNPCVFNLVVL